MVEVAEIIATIIFFGSVIAMFVYKFSRQSGKETLEEVIGAIIVLFVIAILKEMFR